MPVITRLVSVIFRVGEVAFAAVVAGVIGSYLHDFDSSQGTPEGRWIYTEVIAGVSILLALLWLIPFSGGFISWPFDFLLSMAWFAAFGVLVNALHRFGCGRIWAWRDFANDDTCDRWRTAEAFSFLSAIFWIVSSLLGLWFVYRTRDAAVATPPPRRTWYRRHRV